MSEDGAQPDATTESPNAEPEPDLGLPSAWAVEVSPVIDDVVGYFQKSEKPSADKGVVIRAETKEGGK